MAPMRPRPFITKNDFPKVFKDLKPVTFSTQPPRAGPSRSLIRTVAWSPLGALVATGSSDRSVRVWNPDRPNVRYSTELKGHAAGVEKVAFNPSKEAELCSMSFDGVVKFWDVKTKTCTNEVKGLGETFTLAWAPDGQTVVVGNKADKIFILSPTESSPITTIGPLAVQTNSFCFSWDGKVIFMTTHPGKVRILSYPSFEPVIHTPLSVQKPPLHEFTLNGHTSASVSIAHHPQGQYLATGGSDSIISIWSTSSWICHRTIGSVVGQVRNLSFSFDGSYIVAGSDTGNNVVITHTETGEGVHTVQLKSPCPAVDWHPSKFALAFADDEGLKILGLDART